jgi:hypothetical protein
LTPEMLEEEEVSRTGFKRPGTGVVASARPEGKGEGGDGATGENLLDALTPLSSGVPFPSPPADWGLINCCRADVGLLPALRTVSLSCQHSGEA